MAVLVRLVGRWWLFAVAALAIVSGCAAEPLATDTLPLSPDTKYTDEEPSVPPSGATCSDSCAVGAAECEGEDAARVCERDNEGCGQWTIKACRQGVTCAGAPDNCLGDAPVCSDECTTEGSKQCAEDAAAGVLECKRGTSGCLAWAPAPDCAGTSSCDRAKNDGTCKAGCSNDAGCDATTEGTARCSSSKLASQRCKKDGACYRWKTEQVVPQQCTGSGPYACSGSSAKKVCATRQVGACTAHEAKVEACAAGATCSGSGVCNVACPPADGCSVTMLYKTRCKAGTATGRQVCTKSASGCYAWSDTTTCSGGKTCSGGLCSCSGCMFGAVCVSGTQKAACGTSGATCRDCNAYCAGLGRVAQACTSGACSCSQAF